MAFASPSISSILRFAYMSICSRRGVDQRFIAKLVVTAITVLFAVYLSPAQEAPTPAPSTTQQTLPAASNSSQADTSGSAPLRVLVGKSLLINTNGNRIKRISVTDSTIANAIPVSPTQI